MAHNLETNGSEVAFALRGAPAWHNLANRIFNQDEDVTTQTMLEEAKLSNWNVRLSPITDHISSEWNDVSESHLVLRDNPFNGETDVLATVGKRYKVVQNEELFAFADNIHDADPNCRWESAGSLKNGKVVFGTDTHEDAWELGTGFNYSLNEVAELFVEKFSAVKVYMSQERGNYKETIRVNNDAIDRLGWTPTDKLKEYINSL